MPQTYNVYPSLHNCQCTMHRPTRMGFNYIHFRDRSMVLHKKKHSRIVMYCVPKMVVVHNIPFINLAHNVLKYFQKL